MPTQISLGIFRQEFEIPENHSSRLSITIDGCNLNEEDYKDLEKYLSKDLVKAIYLRSNDICRECGITPTCIPYIENWNTKDIPEFTKKTEGKTIYKN